MINSLPIRRSVQACQVTKNTSLLWRHKFLKLLNRQSETRLSGIVKMDETLFCYSEKGSRHLTRPSHKPGEIKRVKDDPKATG